MNSRRTMKREFTALASAARTASNASPDFINDDCRGIQITLDITVASGTGGIIISLQTKDSVTGKYTSLNPSLTALITTGTRIYQFFPGSAETVGNITQRQNIVLPKTFRIAVTHGDSSSYTYSVGIVTIP